MVETREPYRVSGPSGGPNPASLLPFHNSSYVSPTHIDIRALTQLHKLTGAVVARITGVSPRTVRKWHAPPTAENSSPVPYAAWRLLLVETGMVAPIGLPTLMEELSGLRDE